MAVKLTVRQRQVLQLVAEGHTPQEIAPRLRISVVTVALHRRNLLTRLRARDTAQLIIQAQARVRLSIAPVVPQTAVTKTSRQHGCRAHRRNDSFSSNVST